MTVHQQTRAASAVVEQEAGQHYSPAPGWDPPARLYVASVPEPAGRHTRGATPEAAACTAHAPTRGWAEGPRAGGQTSPPVCHRRPWRMPGETIGG